MSVHRVALFAIAALFTAAATSAASAGCCDRGLFTSGCGGCGTPTAAIVYAQPVVPEPPPVAVTVTPDWSAGCGCRRPVVYAAPLLEPVPVAPAPIYVINEGPDYSGPGIIVPYRTWTPALTYAPPYAYPYHRHDWHRFAHRYSERDERVAYREHFYAHPYHHPLPPIWRHYMHRDHN